MSPENQERRLEAKTEHQQDVLDGLRELAQKGRKPTVRSLTDHLEERFSRSERWTDDEVRPILEDLFGQKLVIREQGIVGGEVRYIPISIFPPEQPPA